MKTRHPNSSRIRQNLAFAPYIVCSAIVCSAKFLRIRLRNRRLCRCLFILTALAITLAMCEVGETAPEIPGAAQNKPIALIGGTIHTVSGPVIENGTLLFGQGKIVAVGVKVTLPEGTVQVNIQGKHVYPSLIESYSDIGLTEIGAVRATNDRTEIGSINPNVKAQVAFNPDSELIPVARANGVLLSMSVPSGGIMPGRSALMMMDGWTWEEMTLRSPVAVHVNWPGSPSSGTMKTIRQTIADARTYEKARRSNNKPAVDLRLEALLPVLAGKLPLFAHADGLATIESAVSFAQIEKLKLVIVGGYDAPHCAALLKKNKVPVIVAGVQRLPRRRGDAYNTPFTVPDRLRQAGVQFCISGRGRFSAANVRNLPYHAGTAAAHGLPRDVALKAITLYAAQILGVADRVGSLEAGKDATLLVADGDILETPTQVEKAYIQGRAVDLSSRHTRLWKKYREKYRRQSAGK